MVTRERHLTVVRRMDNPLITRYVAYCESNLRRSDYTLTKKLVVLRQLAEYLAALLGGDPPTPTSSWPPTSTS